MSRWSDAVVRRKIAGDQSTADAGDDETDSIIKKHVSFFFGSTSRVYAPIFERLVHMRHFPYGFLISSFLEANERDLRSVVS